MAPIKQSFAWWSFQNGIANAGEFLRAVKQIGYDGVELLPQPLWTEAQDAGLVIVSEGAGSLTHGLNYLEHHDHIEVEVRQKLELARNFGIPNLIVFSGNRLGLNDERGLANTIVGLHRLVPLAETSGVTIVLELLNSKIDHKDYMCDHTDWAVRAVEKIDSPYVKILYDVYHMQIMEGDLVRTIHSYGKYFGHIHTAGNPGRRDLDDKQEIYYPAIFQALKDVGYVGYVGHEFIPRGDSLDALRRSFHLLRDST